MTSARCDPNKPFLTPSKLDGVNTVESEATPSLSSDGGTLVFARKAPDAGPDDIFIGTRSSEKTFIDVHPISTKINTVGFENDPFLTEDGLTLYFAQGTPASDLFVAVRPTRATDFGDPAPVTNVNTAAIESHPFVTADGHWLYFRRQVAGGGFQIFRSELSAGGQFGTPQAVAELNAQGARNHRATLTADQLTVYFTSDRGGAERIYVAKRDAPTAAFGDAQVVSELSVEDNSLSGHISGDGCVYVFAARVGANLSPFDLWIATKPK